MQKSPSIIFLFGPSGSGKSFAGTVIGEHLNWPVYEADDDISEEMRQALNHRQPFTQAMRDEFFPRVVSRIQEQLNRHPNLVVTQGLYKQSNRDYLKAQLPELMLVYVQASSKVINDRLLNREKGIDIDSANALLNDFDPPADDVPVLQNNSNAESIIKQLNTLLAVTKA